MQCQKILVIGGQQLSWKSSRLTGCHPPRRPTLQHRVEDGEQLPHAGRERQLLGLPRLTQALIEHSNDGISSCGDQRRHIEGRPHMGAPTPNGSSALESAAVAWKRGDAGSGRHFFVRQGPQFRQVREERCGQDRAHPRHTPQHLFFLAPDRTLANRRAQIGVGGGEFLFQPDDMGLER